MVNKR